MLEVGEYIRDIDRGEILQVENVWKDDDRLGIKFKEYAGSNTFSKDDLKRFKHSKDIMDLIEVGDFVNGNKVIKIECGCYAITSEKTAYNLNKSYTDYQIETILTHEQYEKNCYKIGE